MRTLLTIALFFSLASGLVGQSLSVQNLSVGNLTSYDGRLLTFVAVSDWHIDYPGVFETNYGEPADNIRFINTLNPDFLIDTGDEQSGGVVTANGNLASAWSMFSTNLTVPHYHISGNHDDWIEHEWPSDWWTNYFGSHHYFFTNNHLAFIGLQSKRIYQAGISNDYGHIEPSELTWAENQLAIATNAHLRPFLFTHYQLEYTWPEHGGNTLSNLCRNYGVWFLFTGHEHTTNKLYSYPTFTNIALPSMCYGIPAGTPDGFDLVSVYSNRIAIQFYQSSPSNGYPRIMSEDRVLPFQVNVQE